MGKNKGAKNEALRSALRESLEKDRDPVVKIRSHIEEICAICTEDQVEPETLLFQISILRTLFEVQLQKKMMISASADGHEISEEEEKRLKKEFFRFCDMIDVRGYEAYVTMTKQPSLFERSDTLQDIPGNQKKGEKTYASAKERPNYIQ